VGRLKVIRLGISLDSYCKTLEKHTYQEGVLIPRGGDSVERRVALKVTRASPPITSSSIQKESSFIDEISMIELKLQVQLQMKVGDK
jgi:hypothetical protein